MSTPRITLIGGPTALIEVGNFRFLTDPTFDPPGDYQLPYTTLSKTSRPALAISEIAPIDAVLLSHDQHWDNLDKSGRAVLSEVPRVLTTVAAAGRLKGNAEGLAPWQTFKVKNRDGASAEITATPARHGPAGIEPLSGDVVGFVIMTAGTPPVYVTGDTVWFDGVAEVARRYDAGIVLVFAGAAQTRGPFHLTMDTNDAIETARAFPNATIVPVHVEGWQHLRQGGDDLRAAFDALGFGARLRLLEPGVPTPIEPHRAPDLAKV